MGSCCESDNRKTKMIDVKAGGLVWVRRRNGSWWPGRILGQDELPESHAVSPKAGTPVKLLGREDGSMDWYNLEKSKRIKAFRCGEYDDCIEKARASADQSGKSEVKERKYARREDAILHALELEQAHYLQLKQFGSTVSRRNHLVGSAGVAKEQRYATKKVRHQSKSEVKLSQPKVQLDHKANLNTVEVHVMQEERWRTAPTDSEDDGTEGAKRMRGLQELGLGVVSKRKLDLICNENFHEPYHQENASLCEPNMVYVFSRVSAVNSSKEPCTSVKKTAQAHESQKRKNRRRQLTKVLESSSTIEVPSICNEGVNSSQSSLHGATSDRTRVSAPAETNKADCSDVVNGGFGSSETSFVGASQDVLEDPNNAVLDDTNFCSLELVDDGFLDIPVVWKEIQSGDNGGFVSSASGELQLAGVEHCEVDLTKQDSNVDVTSTSRPRTHANTTSKNMEKNTTEDEAKGERNLTGKHSNRGPNLLLSGSDHSGSFLLGKSNLDTEVGTENNLVDESPTSNYNGQRAKRGPLSNSIQPKFITAALKVCSSVSTDCEEQASGSIDFISQSDTRDLLCRPPTHERQRETSFTRSFPRLKVATRRVLSRRKTHPTSCSCCRVEDSSMRNSSSGPALYDVRVEVEARAGYQGRRVPLISLMSKLNGKAIVGHPITVEVLETMFCSTNGRCHGHATQLTRKRETADIKSRDSGMVVKLRKKRDCCTRLHPDARRKRRRQSAFNSLPAKKFAKGRKSGLLARKVRKLSSITVDCEHKEERREAAVDPVRHVACVPLKLVFSRINEALNCPSRSENHA